VGLRSRLLEIPLVYEVFTNGLARPGGNRWLVNDVMEITPGMKVLDVGCGTARILSALPDVEYLGIDHNPKYVQSARARFASRGRFEVLDVNDPSFGDFGTFDRVLLIGVLHHLDDGEVRDLLKSLSSCVGMDGCLITFDCALTKGQHPVARFLAKADRGRFSRSPHDYRRLIESQFDVQNEIIRHDLIRIPYTHIVFKARPKGSLATN